MSNYDPRFQDILMGRAPVASRLTIKEQERLDKEEAERSAKREELYQKNLAAIREKMKLEVMTTRPIASPIRPNVFIRFFLAVERLNNSLSKIDFGVIFLKIVLFGPLFVLCLFLAWPVLRWVLGVTLVILICAAIYDWWNRKQSRQVDTDW